MIKYSVNPVNIDGNFMWELYEEATEHVIDLFFFEEDAVMLANHMEKGGAFDGWTPNFLLTKVAVKEDINQKFSDLVLSE